MITKWTIWLKFEDKKNGDGNHHYTKRLQLKRRSISRRPRSERKIAALTID
jgi:hypothetical protein